mgnify:CR=1 FL=1
MQTNSNWNLWEMLDTSVGLLQHVLHLMPNVRLDIEALQAKKMPNGGRTKKSLKRSNNTKREA